jgi:hypothetical protein
MPSYSYLKTDIINTTENDSTEFSDQIPKLIEKAELRLTKDLDDVGLDEYTAITFTAANASITLNDRVRIIRNVNYTTSVSVTATPAASKVNLLQRTYEYATDYWPVATSTGTPRYYSRKTNGSIYIVPTPVSTLSGVVQTASRPLALASATGTSVTTSNYYSEYCYDALFYGCLLEATMYMKDWATLPVWQQQYDTAITTLRNQARRTRQDDMEVAASPAGGPNTIIQGTS